MQRCYPRRNTVPGQAQAHRHDILDDLSCMELSSMRGRSVNKVYSIQMGPFDLRDRPDCRHDVALGSLGQIQTETSAPETELGAVLPSPVIVHKRAYRPRLRCRGVCMYLNI